jgi:DNA-binding SARP family transcriptional activator/tetratricopeptide (TPR) repeat protein
MESQRYLRCLGQPALLAASGEPIRLRTRKHLALLVYLAVEGGSHRRDRLAELLWPKVSATEARHSLATALSVLRAKVGWDALETSRDHARLIPGRVTLDLDRLRAGDVLGSEVTGPLEVAAFLDGFEINDSTEFTHWKDRQQARLLPVIKDALLVLIDRCRRTGDTRQIEQVADRMLALDELSEEAIRAKMEARAFAGDRLTALEIFEAWKKKLADELHAVPSDLVEGMAIRLRRRGWERMTSKVPNVPTDHWRNRPFIGRTAEYRELYERWESSRKGLPGHVLILGDSGVGKTTLVQRFTTAAGLQGAAISRVQCYDVEREIPYSTLTGLISGLLDYPGAAATSPEALSELSLTVPLVRRRYPSIPPVPESQGETARIRLTEAFLELISTLADEHPVILVADDLHLADDVSIAVLHLIMRRSRASDVMMVLVARPGDLGDAPQAIRLRDHAKALEVLEIEVPPLTEDESRQMLGSLFQGGEQQPGLTEQRALLRAAAGSPMVLEFLVQDWRDSSENPLALAMDAMTMELGIGEVAKTTYSQILHRITRSLDLVTQSALNLAAILGPRLNDVDMYRVVDLSAGQTMTALAELVRRRVLRDGTDKLEFVNELIRGAAYVGVPSTLRHMLHANIADRLLARAAEGDKGLALEIAFHCMRAGRPLDAIPYLLDGARQSLRQGALDAAERALTTALPNLVGQELHDAVFLLLDILQEQGRWKDSLELLSAICLDNLTDAREISAIAAHHWSTTLGPEETYHDLFRLKSLIESSGHAWPRIKAAKVAASLVSTLRDREMARRLLESVKSVPQPESTDSAIRLTDAKAQLMYYAFERSSCREELVQMARHVSQENLVTSAAGSFYTGLGVLACSDGLYADAKEEFKRAFRIFTRIGNDALASSTAAQIGLCCYRLGEYEDGINWSILPRKILSALPFGGYPECQTARNVATCYALLGQESRALETIANFESRIPPSLPTWMTQAWGFHKGDVLLYLGHKADALTLVRSTLGPNPCLHDWGFAGTFARWRALTALDSKQESDAKRELSELARNSHKFDALDRVEVICGLVLLGHFVGPAKADILHELGMKLTKFPLATTHQLSRLGVLPYS